MITKKYKQVISGNDAAGSQLPAYAVILTQHIFGSDRLLGTIQLAITSGFMFYRSINQHSHSNSHLATFIFQEI